ncbi:MAG: SdrD B-like domain-containing protein, partial [Planctomycetota bacterium]
MLVAENALGGAEGFIFSDTNLNGVYDVGEQTFPGVTVNVYRDGGDGVRSNDDTLVIATQTRADGSYRQTKLEEGRFFFEPV